MVKVNTEVQKNISGGNGQWGCAGGCGRDAVKLDEFGRSFCGSC